MYQRPLGIGRIDIFRIVVRRIGILCRYCSKLDCPLLDVPQRDGRSHLSALEAGRRGELTIWCVLLHYLHCSHYARCFAAWMIKKRHIALSHVTNVVSGWYQSFSSLYGSVKICTTHLRNFWFRPMVQDLFSMRGHRSRILHRVPFPSVIRVPLSSARSYESNAVHSRFPNMKRH